MRAAPAPARVTYPDDWTVAQARERYFADNGFSEAGYRDRWVKLKIGPLPVWLPNSPSRQRAVPLHDLHHVATGYTTDLVGEAEIAGYELGGGCGRHLAAWVLNGSALALGLLIAPRRTLAAFARGRRARTLYAQRELDPALLELSVGQLRERLGLS